MIAALAEALLAISSSVELSLLAKATVLIGLGLLAARIAAHSPAAVRHALLAATFGAVLALPLAASSTLDIPIGVPAAPADEADRAPAAAAPQAPEAPPASPPAAPFSGAAAERLMTRVSGVAVVRGLWLAGATPLLAQLGVVLWRLRRVRRTGIPRVDLRGALRALSADAGVGRFVEVVAHEEARLPFTFGLLRPVIVLPPDALEWDEGDLRRALVHELEHVRRADWAVQIGARAICAVWWFHPLVWVAWRRLSLEGERACDDAVVVREESANYADQLVLLARRLSASHSQPVLGMANRSDLSARVSALLDGGRRRGRAGLGTLAGAFVAALSVLLAVAPLRAVGISRAADSPASSGQAQHARLQRSLDRDLYEAARHGDTDEIPELIEAGANVNAAILGDGSPLIAAVRSGKPSIVALLLNRGANPDLTVPGDGSPLIAAAAAGRVDIVDLLLQRGASPNLAVAGDGSPLIAAAAGGRNAVVALLLDRDAEVDLVVRGDENALIQAAGAGHLDVVRTLVGRGANVNARVWTDGDGAGREGEWRTPLGMARKGGHATVVAFLISAGARE